MKKQDLTEPKSSKLILIHENFRKIDVHCHLENMKDGRFNLVTISQTQQINKKSLPSVDPSLTGKVRKACISADIPSGRTWSPTDQAPSLHGQSE